MTDEAASSRVLRFGTFELDLAAGELRKNGRKVRLQEQPFQLLAALVEKPWEVVTREELKDKLWPGDTYVDFDRSLNTAASKLREALGDSASSPRFIETLPRRGYRFLASVEGVKEEGQPEGLSEDPQPARTTGSTAVERATDTSDRRVRIALAVTGSLLAAAAATILVLWFRPTGSPIEPPLRRFSFQPADAFYTPLISPNGRHIAYLTGPQTAQDLWVLDFDQEEPRRLVEAAVYPGGHAWSPDSLSLAYNAGGEIRRVSVEGGPSATICATGARSALQGASWSTDGQWIVFATAGGRSRLYRVSTEGSTPELLFEPNPSEESLFFDQPHLLPPRAGKQGILCSVRKVGSSDRRIAVANLETGDREVLTSGSLPVYSPTGHVVYEAGDPSSLWAVPFSLEKLEATGEPFSIRENASFPSVARDGTLAYFTFSGALDIQLGWRDRRGNKLGSIGQPQNRIFYPALSPDETRVAVTGRDGDGHLEIWIHHADRQLKRRVTMTETTVIGSTWSNSGKELLFSTQRGRSQGVFLKQTDTNIKAKTVIDTEASEFPSDWSRDGNYVIYDHSEPGALSDIWYLDRTTDSDPYEAKPFLATPYEEKAGKISPDGDWVVYVSNETGEYEIYVQRFPESGGKARISQDGGIGPRWSRDGRKLYYVEKGALMEVEVKPGATRSFGPPKLLFRSEGLIFGGSAHPHYDVSADGERFVVREVSGDLDLTLRIVQSWFAEFKDQPEGDE
jgi:Tol biopolymer transport system component/DNA-binding winged helix-turn-helix (wHTH) protein